MLPCSLYGVDRVLVGAATGLPLARVLAQQDGRDDQRDTGDQLSRRCELSPGQVLPDAVLMLFNHSASR